MSVSAITADRLLDNKGNSVEQFTVCPVIAEDVHVARMLESSRIVEFHWNGLFWITFSDTLICERLALTR